MDLKGNQGVCYEKQGGLVAAAGSGAACPDQGGGGGGGGSSGGGGQAAGGTTGGGGGGPLGGRGQAAGGGSPTLRTERGGGEAARPAMKRPSGMDYNIQKESARHQRTGARKKGGKGGRGGTAAPGAPGGGGVVTDQRREILREIADVTAELKRELGKKDDGLEPDQSILAACEATIIALAEKAQTGERVA